MSTKDLIKIYNERAKAAGKQQLSSWKGSRDALQKRIDSLPARQSTNGSVTVADLARELGENPKVLRAKFRRRYASGGKGLPKPVDQSRWAFSTKDRQAVLELAKS